MDINFCWDNKFWKEIMIVIVNSYTFLQKKTLALNFSEKVYRCITARSTQIHIIQNLPHYLTSWKVRKDKF